MTLPLILFFGQGVKDKFSRPLLRRSIILMDIFLKIENLPFGRELLLIKGRSLQRESSGEGHPHRRKRK
jgi:hypothetical protein